MTAGDDNILAIAAEFSEAKPCAAVTLASWYAACIASAHGGGDNFLRTPSGRFVTGEPAKLANGALTGRMHQFTTKGLTDIGGYKISADGSVERCPAELAVFLPGAARGIEQVGS